VEHEHSVQIARAVQRHVGGVVAAYVFGSTARGDAGAASDLDLGLVLAALPSAAEQLQLGGIADLIAAEIGVAVDLVVMNDAPVDLVHRILRDGELVIETDRGARIRFEVRARHDYFDLAPHLLRYRRAPPWMVEP
jgi:predicted nucleotidyltransferase